MGRMFRVITEGPIEAVTAGAALAHSHSQSVENDRFVSGDAPYIEVGGPAAVFHAPKKTIPIEQTPPPVKSPAYLSVSMQPLNTKPAPAVSPVSPEIVAFHHPEHPVSEEYAVLAADMQKQIPAASHANAVYLTSAGRSIGTTTVLLNLAVTLASKAKVLVIDAAFGQSAAAKAMGLGEIPGLADVLNQSVPLAWALQPTAKANLQILAAGRWNAEQSLEEFPKLLHQLKQWFDWILIDGGVWGAHAARDTQVSHCEAVYAVAKQHDSTAGGLRAPINRLGGLLRGVITAQK